MKIFHAQRILALAFICAALAACSDSSIKEVKNSSIRQSDFTYGEILDDARGCKSTDWDHHDDANGRSVVEYTCTAELSSSLIESAQKDNIDRVKALSKDLDEGWQQAFATIQKRKDYVAQAVTEARVNNEAKLKEAIGQQQAAQERLNRALASSPESYITRGPNGYSPAMLEDGRQRMQAAIVQEKLQVEAAQRQIEAIEKAQNDPADAGRQFALDQYRSVSEYQTMLDGMLSWKDRYYAAMNAAEASGMKRASEFLSAAKDRKLQMKITFLVNKKSPVGLQSATWVYDGQDDGGVNMVYLAAILLDPKRMQEVLGTEQRSRLKLEINSYERLQSFPIACGVKIPSGCELRQPAS